MASRVNRAEIWLLDRPRSDRRRPVLILSRPSLITVLHTVTVAAITSTRRGSPTEVDLDVDEGLKGPCCANLCHVFTVAQADLHQFVGTVGLDKMEAVCRALSIATACE
jgi:mRNA-degrading endonuclease toxin of MazEF toxin-antitoxin module